MPRSCRPLPAATAQDESQQNGKRREEEDQKEGTKRCEGRRKEQQPGGNRTRNGPPSSLQQDGSQEKGKNGKREDGGSRRREEDQNETKRNPKGERETATHLLLLVLRSSFSREEPRASCRLFFLSLVRAVQRREAFELGEVAAVWCLGMFPHCGDGRTDGANLFKDGGGEGGREGVPSMPSWRQLAGRISFPFLPSSQILDRDLYLDRLPNGRRAAVGWRGLHLSGGGLQPTAVAGRFPTPWLPVVFLSNRSFYQTNGKSAEKRPVGRPAGAVLP
ncbi:hypothetical protein NL676_002931 [Syzygium grande]|nr:hypothetical protein NL676_002931 [Syzygium grande]